MTVGPTDRPTDRPTIPFADQAVPPVSSLAEVSSGSYPFAIFLANAAHVFVFNQELPKDIVNCVFLEKTVAVHLRNNVPTVSAFMIFFAFFPRTQC
jgi:hypothetical protein